MSIAAKTKNVPKLRFREFSDEWDIKRIDEFAPFQRGYDLPISQIVAGEYPVVFSNGSLKLHNEYKVKAPGVVTGRSGTIGNVHYIEKNYWPHNTSLWVTNFNGNNPKYVYYVYTNFNLEKYGTGSGVPTLNRNDIHRQRIIVPHKKEQEKIAGFLTLVDDNITALQQKTDLLKKYKKGVMRALFPSNAGQAPKIRFKDEDGKEYPDWEETDFGSAYSFLRTNSLSRADMGDSGNVKNIHYGDIHMRLATNFDSSIEKIGFVFLQNGYDLCQPGDIVIADASEDRQDVGKAIEIIKTNGDKIVAGLHTFLARPKAKNLATGFSGYMLQTQGMRKQIMRIANGASVLGISKKELSKVLLNLPAKAEQQKIADFMTIIDAKINSTKKELEQVKNFKKALLQQMFI